jgi:hypothetical protein
MAAAAPPPTAAPVAPPPPTASAAFTAPPVTETTGGGRSIAPLFVAGGGLVVAIIGAGVYASGSNKVSEFEDKCPNRKCPPGQEAAIQEGNDARAQQNLGGALIGVGAVGVAGGLIWYFASGHKSTAQSSPTLRANVTPVVTPGFGGLSLSGRF